MAGGRSERSWIRLHTHRAHCTNACLVFTREEEGSHWTWTFPGTERGQRSLRRGRAGAWLGWPQRRRQQHSGAPAQLPSTCYSPLVPGKGLLGRGWEGRDPLCQQRRITEDTSPSPCALDPNPALLPEF